MNRIQLDRGVPIPEQRRRKSYPFRDMEVGDSFFATETSIVRIHAAARNYKGVRVTCRTRIENGEKGVRVWRIS